MLKMNNIVGYKALLLASAAGAISMAVPASAQGQAQSDEQTVAAAPSDAAIIITGSRIARKDYTSNSPTVTVDEDFIKQSSTAAIEEQLNKLPQFVVAQSSTTLNGVSGTGGPVAAGTSIQPSATSTPGASTVSLRGVGANRTLVLIDGRRGTPGNANGTVDVSTIPSAALERVEIISGGASATYGADAIAGVTNFILKKNFKGLDLDGQFGISDDGNGSEYQISGIVGSDFAEGRGNVSLAMSFNSRAELFQRDNPNYPRLWANTDTTVGSAAALGVGRPGIAGLTFPANRINPTTGAVLANPAQACEVSVRGCVITNYFAGASPGVPNNITAVYLNQDGSLFSGLNNFASRGAGAFFKPWAELDEQNGYYFKTLSSGVLAAVTTNTVQTVPTDRYNFLARGNYEINDWIGVFAQGMFSNSTTYTQLEASTAGDLFIPWGTGKYTGAVPGAAPTSNVYQNPNVPSAVISRQSVVNGQIVTTFTPNPAFNNMYNGILPCATPGNAGFNPTGCTNTEVFQAVVPASIQQLLNARTDPNGRVQLAGPLPNPRQSYQDVTTYTLIAGLQGSVPDTDWTWEAFVNHGVARTISRQTGYYSLNRLRAVITAPNFGQNFKATGNAYGAGSGATTGKCTSGLNFFGGFDGITQDCREAIAEDNTSIGTSRQTIVEANVQGGLLEIPWAMDKLRFAAGASYRELRYSFLPAAGASAGREFQDNIIGGPFNTIMETTGIDAREVYGELLIPLAKDLPFVKSFNLEIGGRVSKYSPGGTSYTYKILGDWEVNHWLRFRGGYNRAERTPNVAEQLLERQVGISIDAIGDVCSTRNANTFSANSATNKANALDVQAVCMELMARDNGGVYAPIVNADGTPNANSYYNPADAQTRQGTGTIFSNSARVGNAVYIRDYNPAGTVLRSEKADTFTLGAVIRSPISSGLLSRLSLTVDYYNITINDPISVLGGGAQLLRCISPNYNPAAAGVAAGASSAAGLNTPEIRARAKAAIDNPDSTCADVFRFRSDGVGGETGGFRVNDVISTYGNEGQIKLSGIDANLNWAFPAGPGRVSVNVNANYTLHSKIRAFDGQPMIDYAGTTGTGALGVSTGSSFRYRLFSSLGYSLGPVNASLQWQHIPKTEDGDEARYLNGLAAAGTDNSGLPAYNLFHFNAGYQLNSTVRIRFGIDNVFDIKPPITGVDTNVDRSLGELPNGNYSLFHDVQGRRFSLGANVRF